MFMIYYKYDFNLGAPAATAPAMEGQEFDIRVASSPGLMGHSTPTASQSHVLPSGSRQVLEGDFHVNAALESPSKSEKRKRKQPLTAGHDHIPKYYKNL